MLLCSFNHLRNSLIRGFLLTWQWAAMSLDFTSFKPVGDVNGSVYCAVDIPSAVFAVADVVGVPDGIPDAIRCAFGCSGFVNCTSFNHKYGVTSAVASSYSNGLNSVCELFTYIPRNCTTLVQGSNCVHYQIPREQSSCSPEQVCRPVLAYVLSGSSSVCALRTFKNKLFVTRANSPLKVYDNTTFALISTITVTGTGSNLQGLVPCPAGDCVYVSDRFNNKLHKLNLSLTQNTSTAVTLFSWSVGNYPRALSVSRQQNLLLGISEGMNIAEYTYSGSLVRIVSDDNQLYQAMEHLINGTFVVSRRGPAVHGVALMSFDGRVIYNYGTATAGSGPGQMNTPCSLAVTKSGYVLVADSGNNRILVLNPTLSDARPLPLPTAADGEPLNNPVALWLDDSKGRLYVGEFQTPFRVLIYDNVINIHTLFNP